MQHLSLEAKWRILQIHLQRDGDTKPNIYTILLLIGLREWGNFKHKLSKQEKEDLLHIGFCKILSYCGCYELKGLDSEGWPQWKLVKHIPQLSVNEQEKFIKTQILEYFEQENLL